MKYTPRLPRRDLVLIVGFSLGLLLLFVNVYLVEKARLSQSAYTLRSERSSDIRRAVEGATTGLALAESAVRAYVLTGDSLFEMSFQEQIARARSDIRSVKQLSLMAPEETLLTRTVESLEERAELLRRAIFLRKISFAEAQDLLRSGEPTLVMRRYLDRADSLAALLSERLAAEADQGDRQVEWLISLTRAGSALAIIVIVLALISTTRYLRERSRSERLLRVSEEKFRLAMQNSPVVHFLADRNMIITMIEGMGLERFGVDARDLVGRRLPDFLGYQDVITDAVAKALGGETVIIELRLGSADVETLIAPFRREGEEIVGITGLWRDISERKRAEKQLEATQDELRRSNTDLEQFAYIASHDLQAPLRSVQEYLRLLEADAAGQFSPQAREFADRMKEGLEQMVSLVQDLLEYSRAGSATPPRQELDLAKLVSETVEEFRTELSAADGGITVGNLPTVYANEAQMRQVFRNLIGNALKFTKGRAPRITVGSRREAGSWTVDIEDNGIGIRKVDYERIFRMFQRSEDVRGIRGNGFGLAITKRIIEKMGGRIVVRSVPGQGSVFSVSFPAA